MASKLFTNSKMMNKHNWKQKRKSLIKIMNKGKTHKKLFKKKSEKTL